jgi:type IV secretory pathway TraG/TraD family ATPase VirD4
MNTLLERIESALIGPEPSVSEREMLQLSQLTLTRRSLTEGMLAIASIGRGKTTLLRTPLRAMLRDGWGGLIPTVKDSMIADMSECICAESRDADLILFDDKAHSVFNPFASITDINEAAALLTGVSEALNKGNHTGSDASFWKQQLQLVLRHLFALCQVQAGKLDLLLAATLFDSRAKTPAELQDPNWRTGNPMWAAIQSARASNDSDAGKAAHYFMETFPHQSGGLQSSLVATVEGVLDQLSREPLRSLFSGESTFSMRDLFDNGKICVVGLPVLSSDSGRIANAILQFCFCREAVKAKRDHHSFLILDEGQELVTTDLMEKMAVIREFKVAVFFLTQNLSVVDQRIGQLAREGLFGLMATRIFGPQNHAATRQWAAEQCGKGQQTAKSTSRSRSNRGSQSSSSETLSSRWDYICPPNQFAQLDIGETIVLRNDEIARVHWHPTHPGRGGSGRII